MHGQKGGQARLHNSDKVGKAVFHQPPAPAGEGGNGGGELKPDSDFSFHRHG